MAVKVLLFLETGVFSLWFLEALIFLLNVISYFKHILTHDNIYSGKVNKRTFSLVGLPCLKDHKLESTNS